MMDMASYGEGSEGMDAALWGQLQNHINLATMVYVKLPVGDFFRLRLVCKEWNRLASDRGFLEEVFRDPIREPYFVVGNWKMKSRLLSYDGSSRRWSWTRVPEGFCEAMAGVFLGDFESKRVFSVHTRVFYDPTPARVRALFGEYCNGNSLDSLMGMAVDTSVRPYTFQIILGDDEVDETRIYHSESDSWTKNPSTPGGGALGDENYNKYEDGHPACAQCNNVVYVRTFSKDDLHSYNLEREKWTHNSPSIPNPDPDDEWVFCDIGAWQDRLFFFGVKESQSSCAVTVFELSNHYEDSWTVFDRLPNDLCLYMLAGQEAENLGYNCPREMKSVFCGEYVLVYKCVDSEEVTERAVLYNLDRKTWERFELPGDHGSSV